jgi:hypothetical protein
MNNGQKNEEINVTEISWKKEWNKKILEVSTILRDVGQIV